MCRSCKSKSEASYVFGNLAIVCWFIWTAHNNFIFEGTNVNSKRIAAWASFNASEFLSIHSSSSLVTVLKPQVAPLAWSCPSGGLLKVNCDIAVKHYLATIAWVLWNKARSIINSFGRRIALGTSVLLADMKAAIAEACIESDNSSIVSCCINEDGVPPEISSVNVDIQIVSSWTFLLFCGYR